MRAGSPYLTKARSPYLENAVTPTQRAARAAVCYLLGACAAFGVTGCGRGSGSAERRDTITQRQRDSAIGASSLPGARGVRGALGVTDSAARRNAQIDSVAKEP